MIALLQARILLHSTAPSYDVSRSYAIKARRCGAAIVVKSPRSVDSILSWLISGKRCGHLRHGLPSPTSMH